MVRSIDGLRILDDDDELLLDKGFCLIKSDKGNDEAINGKQQSYLVQKFRVEKIMIKYSLVSTIKYSCFMLTLHSLQLSK